MIPHRADTCHFCQLGGTLGIVLPNKKRPHWAGLILDPCLFGLVRRSFVPHNLAKSSLKLLFVLIAAEGSRRSNEPLDLRYHPYLASTLARLFA
jgi:hypothetical protein